MKNNIGKNNQGFTIMEILVSIFIIVIVSGIFIANYHNTNKRTDLIAVSNGMAASIRLAQGNALGLVKYNGVVPSGGWGIHLEDGATEYRLFADENNNLSYDPGEGLIDSGARLFDFPPQISVGDISVGSSVDITFLPPNPETRIYNGVSTSTAVTITLNESIGNTNKTVTVNFLGLVEVPQ